MSTADAAAKKTPSLNRQLDVFRRIIQLACAVAVVLLILLWFLQHPLTESPHKRPALGALGVIVVGYMIALELSKGNAAVVLFLIFGGEGVALLALGYVWCAIYHLV